MKMPILARAFLTGTLGVPKETLAQLENVDLENVRDQIQAQMQLAIARAERAEAALMRLEAKMDRLLALQDIPPAS